MKQLKIFYTALFMVVFTITTVNSQNNFHNTHYLDPYNPEYVKGEILIKFKDEIKVEAKVESNAKGKIKVTTGLKSIDKFLKEKQALDIKKVFKETRESCFAKYGKAKRYITDFKGKKHEIPKLYNVFKIKLDTILDAKKLAEDLQKDPTVDFAEPNYFVYTSEVLENGFISNSPPANMPSPSTTGDRNTYPDDPLYQDGSQWYLDAINAPAAWDSITGDTTQIIGIIDTGVDWDHPDLDDNIWTNWNEIPDNGIDDDNNGYIDDTRGWDFINNDNDSNDDNSHGTHVAGIAAAEGNNGIGICGVAWHSKIMPVKMLQSSGTGNSSDLASAIEYASDNGATVINMSLGSYGRSGVVEDALLNIYATTTTLLVAAAGNDGVNLLQEGIPSGNMYPACYPFVLGVRASTQIGNQAFFSNIDPSGPINYWNEWGNNYELMAPGVNILSCKPNGNYWNKSGTSMAAPIVSGICALSKSFNDTLPTDFLWAKLIFGSNSNGIVNAYNTLMLNLDSIGPDLRFIESTLIDTLPGCDGDGRADAGETIQLYFTVKNVGGHADSVWSKIRFGEFEDTTTAIITDSTSYIGDMSTWATLTGELSPLEIKIDSNVVHNRDIVFEYEIGCKNCKDTLKNSLILKIENGEELTGMISDTLILTPNKFWLISGSFKITPNGVLKILPGASLKIESNLVNDGKIIAIGTKDSLISINGTEISSTRRGNIDFKYVNLNLNDRIIYQDGVFEYCNITNNNYFMLDGITYKDCKFKNCFNMTSYGYFYLNNFIKLIRCNLDNFENVLFFTTNTNQIIVQNTNFSRFSTFNFTPNKSISFQGCNNILSYTNTPYYKTTSWAGNYFDNIQNQYWGTSDSVLIEQRIFDFLDDAQYARANFSPYSTIPTDSAHGCVWKVEINGIDPQDEVLPPIGSGIYKFDVYFNKCMDTAYTPLLGFGISEPYLQRIVSDSGHWSSDSTIWTAYYKIGQETGDGINTIHVRNAVDTAGFEIPTEKSRFKFVIQAASAASIDFIATAGIGKVDLEWPPTPSSDALGYNLYRFYNLTDSTYSDTIRINTELILDTVYTDYNVIPDTTYHYMYKTLGTDMVESDYSKTIAAIPFSAANGDANGDMAVNVLDITNIVSYMLNQNPTPFLFDAADVNYDGQINVLDIIRLVQLISGDKSVPLTDIIELSEIPAYYDIADNILSFESEGNVAALQVKFKVQGLMDRVKSTRILNDMKIFSMAKGFEFSYGVVGDEIIGILYSLSGKEIPTGTQELFRFEGVDISKIEVSKIFGGDLTGDYVPVFKKGQQVNLQTPDDYDLKVQPNPFTQSTVISWQLAEEAMVNISIYNLNGEKIKQIKNTYQSAGIYQQTWNATDNNGKKLTAGIYICHIKAKTENKTIRKNVKIILMR